MPEGPIHVSVSELDLVMIFTDFLISGVKPAGSGMVGGKEKAVPSLELHCFKCVGWGLPACFDVIKKLSCGPNPSLEGRKGKRLGARCRGRCCTCRESQLQSSSRHNHSPPKHPAALPVPGGRSAPEDGPGRDPSTARLSSVPHACLYSPWKRCTCYAFKSNSAEFFGG